ncbi:MAG: TPM domain-containing protein [Nanobdellota archaeon]
MQQHFSKQTVILFFVIVLLLLPSLSFALEPSEIALDSYVNDYTSKLSTEHTQQLNALLHELKESGTAQMSILVIDSLDGWSKEEYAMEVAHENLGDEESDNGLLLLVALEEQKYRVEVGYGLEGTLNDAKVGRMAREHLVPLFQQEQYGRGLLQFTGSIYTELTGDDNFTNVQGVALNQQSAPWWSRLGILPFLIVFMLLRGLFGAIGSRKHETKGQKKSRKADDTFSAALLASMFLRGGGGSGGFGGFGGGGFGGGGAGGGW